MQGVILLNYNENLKKVEEEEQSRFLKNLIEQMGVPIDFWVEDTHLSVEGRIKLIDTLHKYHIQVINDNDGEMKVYVDKELVGEWHKCTYKLKRNYEEIDRKKQLYFEMAVDFWTIFDQEEETINE